MLYCNPPQHYYVCANSFQGCCDTNPCSLIKPTCPCTSSTIGMTGSGTAIANAAGEAQTGGFQTSFPASSIPLAAMPIPFASAITEPSSILAPTPTAAGVSGGAAGAQPPILVDTRPLAFPAGGSQTALASSLFASSGESYSDAGTGLPNGSGTMTKGSTSATSTGPGSQSSDSTSSQAAPPSNSKAGAVAGGVIGGLVFAVLALLLFLCCRKRRFRRKSEEEKKPDVVVGTLYEYDPAHQTHDAGTVGAAI